MRASPAHGRASPGVGRLALMKWGLRQTCVVFEEILGPPTEKGFNWARWICHPTDRTRVDVTLHERDGTCIAKFEGSPEVMGEFGFVRFSEVPSAEAAVWLARHLLELPACAGHGRMIWRGPLAHPP